jgi:hypothetical protein
MEKASDGFHRISRKDDDDHDDEDEWWKDAGSSVPDRPRGRPVVLGLPVRKAIDGDDEDEDEWWKDAGS